MATHCSAGIPAGPGRRDGGATMLPVVVYSATMMRRRDFLRFAAIGLGTYVAPALAARRRFAGRVMTVLGPIPPRRMGKALMHEHVLADFIGADKVVPGRYDPEEVFQKILPHLRKLKALGCATFVDCTPDFLGRDPELLRRLSKASGLHIITNTGIYGAADDKFVPRFAYSESAGQLAERWAQEFEKGIPPSGIRPGFMKIGVDSAPLSETDAKLVTAAALTHRRTGLAIASHTGSGAAALAELDILKQHDVPAAAFIWVHAQSESDTPIHRRVAELGAWLEFDGISPTTLEKHVDFVLQMKRAGWLDRVLISQDAGWYSVGEPGGGDFRSYDFIFTDFLPALRKAGASSEDIHTVLVRNPQAALTVRQ